MRTKNPNKFRPWKKRAIKKLAKRLAHAYLTDEPNSIFFALASHTLTMDQKDYKFFASVYGKEINQCH